MSAPVNPKSAEREDAERLAKAPFAASIRARPDTVRVGVPGPDAWMIRAQMPELWDMVRFEIPPTASVMTLKEHTLAALKPEDAGNPNAFVVKLNGIEVLDEDATLADVGAKNGSSFLLMYRRRRPVR